MLGKYPQLPGLLAPVLGSLAIVLGTLAGARAASAPAPVDFNRDIKPIFSDRCFACHGPDENKRKAGLRLDNPTDPFKELKSGNRAIIPRAPDKSALLERITSPDEDEVMPPPKSGKRLSPSEVALLRRWIQEGAVWQKHWAFIPPRRPALPAVRNARWARNEIDYFVLAALEKAGLTPSPEADKTALLRRVTLDLTGLPPTIEEVDAFVADRSSDAYERAVERLLRSPHYGERLAQQWLDLARFADTSGYHFDGVRFMWLWRDWVINVFNNNVRFDTFTIEQVAGDLLPKATPLQRIATGFLRNNMTNDEGGADPDEYLNKYVSDRVNTVSSVWLGLTVGCSECHDHKFDPIKTKEFYQLYAFFNNVPEKGLDRVRTNNPPPRLPLPSPDQAVKFVEADFVLLDAEKTLKDRSNELGETQEKWERETKEQPPAKPSDEQLIHSFPFDGTLAATNAGAPAGKYTGTNEPVYAEAWTGQALKLEGGAHVEYETTLPLGRTNAFTYSAWVYPQTNKGCILSKIEKEPGYRGFDLMLNESRVEVHLSSEWPDNAIKLRTREDIALKQWLHVLVSYDGSGKAAGVKLYLNGKLRDAEVQKDKLTGDIANQEPLRVGARNGQFNFTGLVDEVRFYGKVVTAEDARLLVFQNYLNILNKSRGNRSADERTDLARFYKEHYATDYLRSEAALAKAKKNKETLLNEIPTSLIMEEMDPARESFVLVRGDYQKKGDRVTPGTPEVLPPLPPGPVTRLSLARWLVAPEHPLTARVTVNRFWAMLFGAGLVRTVNDFGSQGEWPSHPDLLDWLAVQFRDGGAVGQRASRSAQVAAEPPGPWDVKGLVRLLVTSAAYRQSAAVSPAKLERDPYNRLISRGPRLRLDAEFIRDNALAVSGLLNDKIGGPSVKPYQPAGIWDGVDAKYEPDHGERIYRRGIYVFWRRSAHYPSFATFDAPTREVCTFLRQRTQTPLQSLVLMNDPVYVEAARALALRVLREEPSDLNQRLVLAFRHTLGRSPSREEIDVLEKTYEQQLAYFRDTPKNADDFLKVGELKTPANTDPTDLAALTTVASVLLNLNETITK